MIFLKPCGLKTLRTLRLCVKKMVVSSNGKNYFQEMVKEQVQKIYISLFHRSINRRLNRISSETGFFDFFKALRKNRLYHPVAKRFNKYYSAYFEKKEEKIEEAGKIITYFDIKVTGKTVLEIGPGNGYFLDVCRDRGAAEIHFLEDDIFYFHYLRIRGYQGVLGDHWKTSKTSKIGYYDFIFSKGAIIVDDILAKKQQGLIKLKQWLGSLENALNRNGISVVCPHFREQPGTGKMCMTPDALDEFIGFMNRLGYSCHKDITGHNVYPNYPRTFSKKQNH